MVPSYGNDSILFLPIMICYSFWKTISKIRQVVPSIFSEKLYSEESEGPETFTMKRIMTYKHWLFDLTELFLLEVLVIYRHKEVFSIPKPTGTLLELEEQYFPGL